MFGTSSDMAALRNGVLTRGVWQAPFWGPDGELVLVAVDRRGCIVGEPVKVPHGSSRIAAADDLLEALNQADPIPTLWIMERG